MIGKVIDKYEVTSELGRGGMGVVYRAMDVMLHREVAIKLMMALGSHNEILLKRFQSEAQALARLDHPNIVRVIDYRKTDAGWALVMEFVEGVTLTDVVEESGVMNWQDAVGVNLQLLEALRYAHERKVIHRDIKPSNILIRTDGRVKVTDFGLAKITDPDVAGAGKGITQTGMVAGTLYYMSPEQVKGLDKVDQRCDLYAAGITLYESMTGRVPFDKTSSNYEIQKLIVEGHFPSPRTYVKDIPQELARIVMKAIEQSPNKRYQSASEMIDDLKSFQQKYIASPGTESSADTSILGSFTGLFKKRSRTADRTIADGLKTEMASPAARSTDPEISSSSERDSLAGGSGIADAVGQTGKRVRESEKPTTISRSFTEEAPPPEVPPVAVTPERKSEKSVPPVVRTDDKPAESSKPESDEAEWEVGPETVESPASGEWAVEPPQKKASVVVPQSSTEKKSRGAGLYAGIGIAAVAVIAVILFLVNPGLLGIGSSNTNTSTDEGLIAASDVVSVQLSINPSSADISIDGSPVDAASLSSLQLTPGAHSIELYQEGYMLLDTTITIAAGQESPLIALALVPVPEEEDDATPAVTGAVRITSQPSGADVLIDGRRVGRTPFESSTIAVGNRQVRLRLSGYDSFTERVRVSEGSTTQFAANLVKAAERPDPTPTPITPPVTRPPAEQTGPPATTTTGGPGSAALVLRAEGRGVRATVNGQEQTIGAPIVLTPGAATVVFTAGGQSLTRTIQLSAGDSQEMAVSFRGYLDVNVVDESGQPISATISVGGRPIGDQTSLNRHRLDVGTYVIKVSKPGYQTFEQSITVSPKFGSPESQTVNARLRAN